MTALYWVTAIASLAGVVLNIRHHVACFWIWAATNAIWTVADWRAGLPQQAVVQAVYFGLSLYGIRQWSKRRSLTPQTTGDHQ